MAKTIRVHTLAKQIGVSSKDIIAKCEAEGIEVKNHMASIPVGLAESIKEWFSPGDDVTSVESAERVDMETIRKAQRRQEAAAQADHDEGEGESAVATLEIETESVDTEESVPEADSPPAIAATTIEPPAPPATSAEPEPASAADDEPVDEAPEPPVERPQTIRPAAIPVPEPAKPPRREVRPAGPQVVPQPADLKGPRVVRIEAPEQERRPPRRPAAAAGPMTSGVDSTAPRTGGGKSGSPAGRKTDRDAPSRARSPRRHGNAADISERMKEWRDRDVQERRERLASATGHGLKAWRSAEQRRVQAASKPGTAPRKAEVAIVTPINVKDFCSAIGVGYAVISRALMQSSGKLIRINDQLDLETAEMIAMELGITLKAEAAKSPYEALEHEFAQRERKHLKPRPPVVAMLGHVDHGKTSLLDAIRRAKVAAGEAGGITQHIGAYRVDRGDWHVTFIDTPGHEAFTQMRARGANLTDVVVLVVAADDGVMPQTIEAMNHAKAAGVQIVVALNKIDLPGVDLNKIYGELATHELTPTEWGGSTDVIKTSATKGEGVDDLLAHLSTLSELLDLKADSTVPAMGTVIEARMKEGQGVVAQVLVREGTLKPGQVIVCGPGAGRVRALIDDRGKRLNKADPGTPVEVIGLDRLPETGDKLFVVSNLNDAKVVAEQVYEQRRQQALGTVQKARGLEDLLAAAGSTELPELNVIVRSDNQGSLEALLGKLREIPDNKARLKILHGGVGQITEADVSLAQASKAVIFGFHIVPEDRAQRAAEQAGVQIRTYRVIYEMMDDVRAALEGLLTPDTQEQARGKAEVREVFNITRVGTIAGCYVTDGVIARNCRVRLLRDGRIITDGNPLDSLKRFKDDVREVRAGMECGIKISSYDDLKPGDVIEAFELVEVAQKL